MAGNFDFLHVKRRTAGSSNELSFDVLEHKSDEAESKASRSSKLPKPLKASQGSYTGVGVGGSSTLTGKEEVEKRKKARRARRVRIQVVTVAAVIALVAVGIYVGLQYRDTQIDLSTRTHMLVDRLSAVDETLMKADALMVDPLDFDKAAAQRQVEAEFAQMTTELNRISVDAQSLLDLPLDDASKVAVGQISRAARARTDMVKAAKQTFDLAEEAQAHVTRANTVWGDVLDEDQLAREAVSSANKAKTQDATNEALSKTREVMDGFARDLSELEDLSTKFNVDLSAQKLYLQKKTEALQLAVAVDEALLAGNREAAISANELYNAADQEAAELAAGLPPSIGDVVMARFQELMAGHEAQYARAREDAVSADAAIREYLAS